MNTKNKKARKKTEDEKTIVIETTEEPAVPGEEKQDTPPGGEAAHAVESESKQNEIAEKYLRVLAEYDNYRKRAAREMIALAKTATENLIIEILPILDNLDLATEHKDNPTSMDEYVKGVALIEDQLRDVLAAKGLIPIEAVGKPFDPNLHDAVSVLESDEYESGMVMHEVQKGYQLGDKVIRHSKVVVSK